MIRRIMIFSAVLAGTLAQASGLDSVTQSPPLTRLLSTMSKIADDGPGLSYFGWDEADSAMPDQAICKGVVRSEAVNYLKGLIKEMDWATTSQVQLLESNIQAGMNDFRTILGSHEIQRCDWEFSEPYTYTKVVRFNNRVSGYQITFSEGYED